MGPSLAIGGLIAHGAFWVLIVLSWFERGAPTAGLFIALWLAGWLGLPLAGGEGLFLPLVAVLDIALVLLVFRGDVRLT